MFHLFLEAKAIVRLKNAKGSRVKDQISYGIRVLGSWVEASFCLLMELAVSSLFERSLVE